MFDTTKSGFIETIKIATLLNSMGQIFDDGELNDRIAEVDVDSKCLKACLLGNHSHAKKTFFAYFWLVVMSGLHCQLIFCAD